LPRGRKRGKALPFLGRKEEEGKKNTNLSLFHLIGDIENALVLPEREKKEFPFSWERKMAPSVTSFYRRGGKEA